MIRLLSIIALLSFLLVGCTTNSADVATVPAPSPTDTADVPGSSQPANTPSAPDLGTSAEQEGGSDEPSVEQEVSKTTDTASPGNESGDEAEEGSKLADSTSKDGAGEEVPGSEVADSDVATKASSVEAPIVAAEPSRERLLLLPPTGPIVIELLLTQGSESLVESWHENTAKVVELIDADDDGKTTWDELIEDQTLLRLAFGNLNLEGDQAKTIIRSYDANSNDVVEPEEFTRFLGRNQRNVGELVVEAEAFDPFKRVAQSGIRKWLDKNGDGILSNEDKQNAGERLMMRDADEDRRLFAVDFAGATAAAGMANPNQAMMQYQRRRGPEPVRIIHDDLDWGQLRVDMEEIYAYGNPLTEEDFGESGHIFSNLDSDGDDELSTLELAGLMDIAAHITIAADRQSNRVAQDALPELQPESSAEDSVENPNETEEEYSLAAMYQPAATSRLNIGYRALLLEVTSVASRSSNYGDFDKAFAAMDRDKNQYLNMQELQTSGLGQVANFEEVDRDDDSKVSKEELGRLFEFIDSYEKSGLVVSVRPNDDPVFAVLDVNRTGQLEAREILTAGQRLDDLDKNRDGRLSSTELPATLTVSLSGRQPYQQNRLNLQGAVNANNTNRPKESSKAPAWFTQMDRNQDGEVDATEFLGDASKFQAFDKDSDGFFEVEEIEAVEAQPNENDAE